MCKKVILSGFVAGLVMLLVSLAMMFVWSALLPSVEVEYQNGMFRLWSDSLMMVFFAGPFMLGLVFAWIWDKTKTLFKAKEWWKKAGYFAGIYLIFSAHGMFMTWTSFNISILMVTTWLISGFIQALFAAAVLVKMNK